ncbi:MAG: hypothetical protein QF752_05915 [Planctomycetota bacterium]|nr:hypothetical protein [Planctomycetota bacterium]
MRLKTATTLFLAAVLTPILIGCGGPVQYRHEVETPGTQSKWKEGMGGFVRYDGYDDVAGDFEIAVADYRKEGSPVTIRLVGVVHIGDADYYRELQDVLDDSDLVLYEGVGPGEGKIFPMVSSQWRLTAEMMGTAPQVSALRYQPGPNWIQVDLATERDGLQQAIETYSKDHGKRFPSEFPLRFGFSGGQSEMSSQQKMMAEAFDALHKVLALKRSLPSDIRRRRIEDAIKHGQATQMTATEEFSADQYKQLFVSMKRQAEELGRQTGIEAITRAAKLFDLLIEVVEFYSAYIVEIRNEFVIKVLKEHIGSHESGNKPSTISIFYGAAHLPDFEERLAKMGYQPVDKSWYKAWKMNSKR